MNDPRHSRTKLWLGTILLCVAVLVWFFGMYWATSGVRDLALQPGKDLDAAMAAMPSANDLMLRMLSSYAIAGLITVLGLVTTVMGLIDYAAERRATAPLAR